MPQYEDRAEAGYRQACSTLMRARYPATIAPAFKHGVADIYFIAFYALIVTLSQPLRVKLAGESDCIAIFL